MARLWGLLLHSLSPRSMMWKYAGPRGWQGPGVFRCFNFGGVVMRVLGKSVLTLAALALLASPALAQFGPPRQGGPTGDASIVSC